MIWCVYKNRTGFVVLYLKLPCIMLNLINLIFIWIHWTVETFIVIIHDDMSNKFQTGITVVCINFRKKTYRKLQIHPSLELVLVNVLSFKLIVIIYLNTLIFFVIWHSAQVNLAKALCYQRRCIAPENSC